MSWFINLKGGKDVVYLVFSFVDHKYLNYQSHVEGGGEKQLVTKDVFKHAINKVKDECKGVARSFILELQCHFPQHEVMTALGVIYHHSRLQMD